MSRSNGTGLEALKITFRPFRIQIPTESGDALAVWSLPMQLDVGGEKRQRDAMTQRLAEETTLEGAELEAVVHTHLLWAYLADRLVKPPTDPDRGFAADERPEPLFESPEQVPEYLSYNAMMRIRLAIQESGLKFAPEPAVKN